MGHPATDAPGPPAFESLEHALANSDDYRPYQAREEQRRLEHHAQEERERQEEEDAERRREAAAWPCPTCGREVLPNDWEPRPTGSDCSVCTSTRRREQADTAARAAEEEEGREEARRNGLFGFLR
ncbi:hypothetical protein [[Kitasatospora] papulosa]|uniref:hypothetical protein n=1 Tax=[Kitasatospora] papulosa TaxID=1464011 RepID=UPI0036CA1B6B